MPPSRTDRHRTHDVAVLGSGLPGTVLGAVLARAGADVVVLDETARAGGVTGESLTPRAAVALRAVAERYEVPEIEALASFEGCARRVGSAFGVRRHFGFLYHREGLAQDPREVHQYTNGPLADAPHLYRPDTDAYMLHVALRHGCGLSLGAPVEEMAADGSGVTLARADGSEVRARFVVDASGRSSPVARLLGLREEPTRLRHRSRSLWTHMAGVRRTDEVLATARPGIPAPPIPWHEGSVHHVFEGGWLWVLPFDNHKAGRAPLCSVGVGLDPRRHPAEPGRMPGDDFAALVARFPDLERQFAHAAPVREWESADPVQYSSTRTVGERWCLLGESAGAVDRLFYRDLSDTVEAINLLAWRLLDALREDDFDPGRFEQVERLQQALLDRNDELVGSAYAAFSDHALWNAVFRVWAWGTGAGTFRLQEALTKYRSDGRDAHFREIEETRHPGLLWPDHDGFRKLFEEMVARCRAYEAGIIGGGDAAAELWEIIRSADFVPRHLGYAEPDQPYIHPTPRKAVRSLRWVRAHGDPELRRVLSGNAREALRSRLRGRTFF
ncbi:tryptophan 7-halogenase [Actinomadura viridis]|uniref:FADH2 O2-dependent halogenase n=1 Tax=Actinomadura viridis TaxID=58110 RepID=A0A931GNZ1_9ACTN|nr:FAD-dependent monooxygenase [Actinomadura viridis]MBG6086884.1 FADH2 O2-dependent halogenase [Actinomadura viridis]